MYMKVMCNFPVLLAELKYDIAYKVYRGASMPDRLRRVIKVENFGFTSHVQDC